MPRPLPLLPRAAAQTPPFPALALPCLSAQTLMLTLSCQARGPLLLLGRRQRPCFCRSVPLFPSGPTDRVTEPGRPGSHASAWWGPGFSGNLACPAASQTQRPFQSSRAHSSYQSGGLGPASPVTQPPRPAPRSKGNAAKLGLGLVSLQELGCHGGICHSHQRPAAAAGSEHPRTLGCRCSTAPQHRAAAHGRCEWGRAAGGHGRYRAAIAVTRGRPRPRGHFSLLLFPQWGSVIRGNLP